MAELQKAKLQAVEGDKNESKIGDAVEVQFNPTTLSLKLKNAVEGGRSQGKQRRQQTGASSNTLSMELVFDTADEGTADAPVSVRSRTAIVEQFVVPPADSADPPPRLRFEWDQLILTGIVEDVSIEFDLFAANGAPLRAKVGLTLKEQKPEYQFLAGGAGARGSEGSQDPGQSDAASVPGAGTNAPDGAAPGALDRVAQALDGESPAEFMNRMGLDPAAWRGLDADLSLGLGFEAGVEVGFSASLGAGVGLGVSAGVQAGIGASLEASLGLGAASGAAGGDAAGRAMAELGGVAASADAVAIARAEAALSATAQAFEQASSPGAATATAAATPPATAQTRDGVSPAGAPVLRIDRAPLARTGPRGPGAQPAAGPRPPLPAPDPRAVTFGFGVPLQPLRATTTAVRSQSRCVRASGFGSVQPPLRSDPTAAPWTALPPVSGIRRRADTREREKEANPCGLLSPSCSCDHP